MYLSFLGLKNFRNYTELSLEPCASMNIFTGMNGQGKTNILESVFFLSTGRSHRTSRDAELIKWEENNTWVKTTVQKRIGSLNIDIEFAKGYKNIAVNGMGIMRLGQLMGNLNTVIFSPEDLRLIDDGPGVRRRFLDIELSQLYPGYFFEIQRYLKVLKQRNHQLRLSPSDDMIDMWDDQLSVSGAKIMMIRDKYIKKLSEEASLIHSRISDGGEELGIKYLSSVPTNSDRNEIYINMMAKLKKGRNNDFRRGNTSSGIHRDDVNISIDGKDARHFASQGQKRTAVLAIKLSEVKIARIETGENPVLLLDDVMSELDELRRSRLLAEITGLQTFITTTELDGIDIKAIDESKIFEVNAGNIALL